jgi:hypothetical protein
MQVFTRNGHVRLLGIDNGNRGMAAEIRPKISGRFYDVVLRYAGGWKPGPIASTIRVRTDDRSFPVQAVPFCATVE